MVMLKMLMHFQAGIRQMCVKKGEKHADGLPGISSFINRFCNYTVTFLINSSKALVHDGIFFWKLFPGGTSIVDSKTLESLWLGIGPRMNTGALTELGASFCNKKR